MIITSKKGLKYRLTKTWLRETDVSHGMFYRVWFGLRLKDLKKSTDGYVALRCIGAEEGYGHYLNPRETWTNVQFTPSYTVIGCARFDKATAKLIADAVKAS
jgi:hypothetical protein